MEASATGDGRVVELIGTVVRRIAGVLSGVYESTGRAHGYVRAQVQPTLAGDRDAMLAMGRRFASWAPNIMVKIPGTSAGLVVLEELAAAGIPTTPTVNTTVAQMLAVAEANERGVARALAAGIVPAPSTAAIVIGRLQDYLAAVNAERGAGVSTADLEAAVTAVARRVCRLFRERGYRQAVMPAAFRSPHQVAALVGADVVMTIHPSVQESVARADAAGELARNPAAIDAPADAAAVDRVSRAIPEFVQAYEPDGLEPADFGSYGAVAMTLSNFDSTGWQKLRTL